jgi:molecular chaperone GrpE
MQGTNLIKEGDKVSEMKNKDVMEETEKEPAADTEKAEKVDENKDNHQDNNEEQQTDVIDVNELTKKLKEKEKECEEYLDLLKRTKAEFDNYRKRVAKEKESMYDDGFADAIKAILPVIDNLERAVQYKDTNNSSLAEGVEMVLKMFKDTLTKVNVEEILAEGQKFDPDYHNAVMHIEDENFEENTVVEVFQKGYKYKDKVIRYSMVKVAN